LIEQSLSILVGKRWRYVGRALDLTWMGFGEEIHNPTKRNPGRRTGEWALYVQCPLRISKGAVPLLGTLDLYMQAEDPYETPRDFDFEQSDCLWDERADELNELLDQSTPHVTTIAADAWGGLTVELTDDVRIAVFPWASYLTEAWSFDSHRDPNGFLVVPSNRR